MKFRVSFPWLVVSVLAAGAGLRAAEPGWHALLNDSPFGATTPAAEAPAAAQPEFRGYVAEGREQYFNIYDPARKRAFWLRRGETAGAVTVQSFDADRQQLTVAVAQQAQTLSMKQAKVLMSAQLAPVPAAAAPASPPGPTGGTIAADPNPALVGEVAVAQKKLADARQRQAAIADKVRVAAERRRQLQVQAAITSLEEPDPQ